VITLVRERTALAFIKFRHKLEPFRVARNQSGATKQHSVLGHPIGLGESSSIRDGLLMRGALSRGTGLAGALEVTAKGSRVSALLLTLKGFCTMLRATEVRRSGAPEGSGSASRVAALGSCET